MGLTTGCYQVDAIICGTKTEAASLSANQRRVCFNEINDLIKTIKVLFQTTIPAAAVY